MFRQLGGRWLTLIAKIATVVAAVIAILAYYETTSLRFRLASQTPLAPNDKHPIAGLRVSVDGTELNAPYLSVFELLNDGTRTIRRSDFESPLILRIEPPAFIVRATVTATTPTDLQPEVTVENQAIKLSPLLLNPGDGVTFAVISSGQSPRFASGARIAGVKSVPITLGIKGLRDVAGHWITMVAAYVMFVSAVIVASALPKGVFLRPRASVVVGLATYIMGLILVLVFLTARGLNAPWMFVSTLVALGVPAAFAAPLLNFGSWRERQGQDPGLGSPS